VANDSRARRENGLVWCAAGAPFAA